MIRTESPARRRPTVFIPSDLLDYILYPDLLPVSLVTGNISVGVIAGLIQFAVCCIIGFGVFGTLKKERNRWITGTKQKMCSYETVIPS